MKIYRSLFFNNPNKKCALVLGFFDGVHIAHQKLIQTAVLRAKEKGIKTALITFQDAPPIVLFKKEPKYIETLEKRMEHIEENGADFLYILDFNDFKDMGANDYLEKVIVKNFEPEIVVTGFNHTFGRGRLGTRENLRNCKKFEYVEMAPVKQNGILVSSTNIRNFIESGEINLANKMLGRNFSMEGEVIKGAQIARELGYKTANLHWQKGIVKLKYGVYFGLIKTPDNKKHKALINFGLRPTVDKMLKETLEAHILDFEGDLYNQKLEVEFISRLRDEIKFSSLEELKAQIKNDYNIVRVQTSTNIE